MLLLLPSRLPLVATVCLFATTASRNRSCRSGRHRRHRRRRLSRCPYLRNLTDQRETERAGEPCSPSDFHSVSFNFRDVPEFRISLVDGRHPCRPLSTHCSAFARPRIETAPPRDSEARQGNETSTLRRKDRLQAISLFHSRLHRTIFVFGSKRSLQRDNHLQKQRGKVSLIACCCQPVRTAYGSRDYFPKSSNQLISTLNSIKSKVRLSSLSTLMSTQSWVALHSQPTAHH